MPAFKESFATYGQEEQARPDFRKRNTQAYALGMRVRQMHPKSSVAQIARALHMPENDVRAALPRTP